MPTRKNALPAALGLYPFPTVSREEALRPEASDDGERCLDEITNGTIAEDPGDKLYASYMQQRRDEIARIQDEEQQKNREFKIDEANFTKAGLQDKT